MDEGKDSVLGHVAGVDHRLEGRSCEARRRRHAKRRPHATSEGTSTLLLFGFLLLSLLLTALHVLDSSAGEVGAALVDSLALSLLLADGGHAKKGRCGNVDGASAASEDTTGATNQEALAALDALLLTLTLALLALALLDDANGTASERCGGERRNAVAVAIVVFTLTVCHSGSGSDARVRRDDIGVDRVVLNVHVVIVVVEGGSVVLNVGVLLFFLFLVLGLEGGRCKAVVHGMRVAVLGACGGGGGGIGAGRVGDGLDGGLGVEESEGRHVGVEHVLHNRVELDATSAQREGDSGMGSGHRGRGSAGSVGRGREGEGRHDGHCDVGISTK